METIQTFKSWADIDEEERFKILLKWKYLVETLIDNL